MRIWKFFRKWIFRHNSRSQWHIFMNWSHFFLWSLSMIITIIVNGEKYRNFISNISLSCDSPKTKKKIWYQILINIQVVFIYFVSYNTNSTFCNQIEIQRKSHQNINLKYLYSFLDMILYSPKHLSLYS